MSMTADADAEQLAVVARSPACATPRGGGPRPARPGPGRVVSWSSTGRRVRSTSRWISTRSAPEGPTISCSGRPMCSVDRAAVHGGERLVDAHVALVGVEEGQAHRRGREQRVEQAQRALGGVVAAARCRSPSAQRAASVSANAQVPSRVVAALLGGQQRQRAEHAPARHQRHDHVRARAEAVDTRGARRGGCRRATSLPTSLTSTGSSVRWTRSDSGAPSRAPPPADLDQQRLEHRIRVATRDLALATLLVGDVDGAPVGDVGDRQLGDLRSVWSKSSEPASTVPARLRNSSALSGEHHRRRRMCGGFGQSPSSLPAPSYVRRWRPAASPVRPRASHRARQLAQPKALHLAGEGARQVLDEVHAVGVLVAAQARPCTARAARPRARRIRPARR